MKQVVNAGAFLYVVLPEEIFHPHTFSHLHSLLMLAQFVLKVYVEASKNKRASAWPLIASPICIEQT